LHSPAGVDAGDDALRRGFFVAVVPLIWPAKNSPSMALVSSEYFKSRGSKKSYSIA